eukprot:TRINITY_DN6861_c0_g1_i1.p2 TRINITY_DN6861_c0_g1~~TRINITY_DN6861_c0_g1_i1.p2  ORF type:complete len:269 (+),score=19.07 TRINITY_DN6861_c0_g1_i1:355-1161(+)
MSSWSRPGSVCDSAEGLVDGAASRDFFYEIAATLPPAVEPDVVGSQAAAPASAGSASAGSALAGSATAGTASEGSSRAGSASGGSASAGSTSAGSARAGSASAKSGSPSGAGAVNVAAAGPMNADLKAGPSASNTGPPSVAPRVVRTTAAAGSVGVGSSVDGHDGGVHAFYQPGASGFHPDDLAGVLQNGDAALTPTVPVGGVRPETVRARFPSDTGNTLGGHDWGLASSAALGHGGEEGDPGFEAEQRDDENDDDVGELLGSEYEYE